MTIRYNPFEQIKSSKHTQTIAKGTIREIAQFFYNTCIEEKGGPACVFVDDYEETAITLKLTKRYMLKCKIWYKDELIGRAEIKYHRYTTQFDIDYLVRAAIVDNRENLAVYCKESEYSTLISTDNEEHVRVIRLGFVKRKEDNDDAS